jgi:SNF2 family DNA or RNA helicase
VLGQLATHFAVSSELALETPEVQEVPADARLHIQLRRAGAGLRVRWCVLPLGSGPQFAPGAGSANVLGTRLDQASSTSVRCTRDLLGEARELARVLTACPTLSDVAPETREHTLTDLTSCLELLCELRALGDSVLVEWPDGQPLTVLAERELRDVKLKLRESGSWFEADGELSVDATRKLSFRELLELTKERTGRFIRLEDGQFVALTHSLQRGLDSALALSRVRGKHLELHPLSVLGVGGLSDMQLHTDPQIAERLERAREAPELVPEVPHTFEASLRPYQQQGYVFLSRLAHWGAGAVLADDMGLGKTLQTLALMVEQGARGPALVVAPTSVCTNWLDEARKFAPSLRVLRFGSGTREQTVRELGPFDVLVCSYGVLQQHGELLASKRFQVIVLDEAQAIKNASTRRAKAALELVGNVRIALTGTPIENHLGELWSILSFANPGLLGSPKSFEDRFVKPIQRDGDRAAAQLLRRIIKPFVLRRRKSEVLDDLPEKTIITLRVEPSDDERAFFAALREQALSRVTDRDKPGEARIRLLAELMRLRRAACHPALVAPDSALASSKLATLEALLEELIQGGHRVLVFSQFVDYLTLVRERLSALQISHQYLDGSSSTRARADSVAAFQAGTSDVFLISLKAGGFGLNLTAADYVVHLDPWWNPAVEDQASDRAHRIGQTRPVTIYRLVMEGSIEEKILALHASKRELADDLLAGTGTGPALGLDELMALLGEASAEPRETAPKKARGR